MKICFITYHNWDTKRHGGFHQFAQACADKGHETLFFSFARPYYIRWKHEERLNSKILKKLSKGQIYKTKKGLINNFTIPTLALPGPLRKFVPKKLNKWLMIHSFTPFSSIKKRWLKDTDCFVFESCEAVLLVEKIKKEFPKAKIIYRPSDPLWEFSNDFFSLGGEAKILKLADRIITVNIESIEGYKYKFPHLFDASKYICIPNGVNIQEYLEKYEKPELLRDVISSCYIGSFLPDWSLLQKAAQAIPEMRFIIITPHKLDEITQKVVDSIDNLFYIDGIPSKEVPKWITNCNIVIQPFPIQYGRLNKKSIGLTAQNYKAMAANKPIVTYNIPLDLSRYGLITTDNSIDFINGLKSVMNSSEKTDLYSCFDLQHRDWKYLCEQFINECEA